jgi:hypothetical protein
VDQNLLEIVNSSKTKYRYSVDDDRTWRNAENVPYRHAIAANGAALAGISLDKFSMAVVKKSTAPLCKMAPLVSILN